MTWWNLAATVSHQHKTQAVQLNSDSFTNFLEDESALICSRSMLSQGLFVSFFPSIVRLVQPLWQMEEFVTMPDEHSFLPCKLQSFDSMSQRSFLVCPSEVVCQGWRVNKTPTIHNTTQNSLLRLNLSCPQNQKIKTPESKLDVLFEHWPEAAGINANPTQVVREPNEAKNPWNSTAATSDRGTTGNLCLISTQIMQEITTPIHLIAWSSKSGILLSSNWTEVIDAT